MKREFTTTHIRGALTLLLATVLYGTMGVLSRYIGYNLPLFYQNVTREFFAFLLISWSIFFWKSIKRKDIGWLMLRSIAGAFSFLLYFTAINAMPIGTTYFIFYSGLVIGGFIIGQLFFHEHVTLLRIASLFLAGVGLLFVYGFDFSGVQLLHVLMALGAGICTTVWNTVAKKVDDYTPLQLTAVDNAITTIIYLLLSLGAKEVWPAFALSPVMIASLSIGLLFVGTGLLVIYGFSRLEVQVASLIMLAEILFAIFFGYLVYKEMPAPTATIGGILIILAMVLPEVDWKKAYAYRRKNNR